MTDLVTRIDSMSDGEVGEGGAIGTKVVSDDELRVSTLELFFDLVFVFTITQLTAVLVHHPNGEALAQIVLMLAAIWWMYGAFAWLTNAVPPDRRALRLPLLAGMLAFFAISLTDPDRLHRGRRRLRLRLPGRDRGPHLPLHPVGQLDGGGCLELRANESRRRRADPGRSDHRRDGGIRVLEPRGPDLRW